MKKKLLYLLAVLITTTEGFSQEAIFESLGVLAGGVNSMAHAVSADGSFIVGESESSFGPMGGTEAFTWLENFGIVGIGDLPGGLFNSFAHGVSFDGSIIAGTGWGDGFTEAVRWQNGIIEGIGFLPDGFDSYAYAVSDDGQTIVGYGYNSIGVSEAFRWTEASGIVGLGFLPGGFESIGYDVSSDGSVIVGYALRDDGFYEAFRWTEFSGLEGLGDLPGGDFESYAWGVSADGSTIVGYSSSGPLVYEAFRWTETEGMVNLGDLPGGGTFAIARGVSSDGTVIVGEGSIETGSVAFYWTAQQGMRNLKEILEIDYSLDLQGWTLNYASDVSDDGRTIVGYGTNPSGQTRAYRVTLPESTPCLAPSDISFSIVTPTTANVSWVENGSSFTWEIEYGESGFIQGSGTTVIDNDGFLGETLTDLTPSTLYDVYVRSHCTNGESDWTGPVSFFTADAPLCIPPSNISVSVVTDTVVFVSWTENGSASEWEIEYGESGFMQGEGLVVIDNDGVPGETIGGLTQGVLYDVYIRSVCEFTESNWEGPTSFVIEPEPCSAPSEVSVDNVSPTMVYVNWTENGSANEWELEYGESGFVQGEGTVVIDNDGVTGEAISGLESETDYEVYVRSICEFSESEWTGPIPFTTEGELGINENIMDKVVLYPNPTTGIINMKTEEPITQAGVYTITGSKLPVQLSETGNTIDISDLSTGLYFVRITVNNQSQTFKVIKQ